VRRIGASAAAGLRRSSITIRLALVVGLVVGLTTAAIGGLAYTRARRALESAARTRLQLLARDMARDLHAALADRVADITTWSRLEAMLALTYGDIDKELAEFMRHAISGRPAYQAIAGFDVDGRRVVVSGDVSAVPLRLGIVPSTRLRVGQAGGARDLVLETPVWNPRKPAERIGILAAFLAPGELRDALTDGRDQQGPPVDVTVLTAEAGPIIGTGGDTDPSHRPGGAGERAMLEATAHLPAIPGADGPLLSVVVREPVAEALASVLALRATVLRIGLVVLLLSVAIGGAVAWRISAPIRQLTAAVREITAQGRPEPMPEFPESVGEVGVLSAAFRAMLERLTTAQREAVVQSRRALLGEVAASLAHDVRTPLSVLKTSAQLLAGGELPPGEQRDLARMVAAEVDRVNGVVSQLVDLARPRTRQVELHEVDALVESAVAVIRPWARSAGVTVETAPGAGRLRVRTDRDQMQQVLLNLVHNAVQAASRPGRVVVRWAADPPWAVIEVTDSGPGFTPDALARAFSPFFTTRMDGTGLGLAITKRIVEEQGGSVGARNLAAGGACVWLLLPQVPEPA